MTIAALINKSFSKIFCLFEYYLSIKWFNPLHTLYINLRCLPIRQAIKIPIFVYGVPKFYNLSGNINIIGNTSPGMIKFNITYPGSPSNMSGNSELNNAGKIIFRGKCVIRTGNRIVVGYNAKLDIGEGVIIADKINIGCFTSITIGDRTRIAHRSQIFDNNYHYILNLKKNTVKDIHKSVKIGADCWICNSSTITGSIPNGTIVASNSVVNGKTIENIEDNCLIGGIPAKLISTGLQLINDPKTEQKIAKYFNENNVKIVDIEQL